MSNYCLFVYVCYYVVCICLLEGVLEHLAQQHTLGHELDARPPGRRAVVEADLVALVADKWGLTLMGPLQKVRNFDRLGNKVRPGTFGNIKVG